MPTYLSGIKSICGIFDPYVLNCLRPTLFITSKMTIRFSHTKQSYVICGIICRDDSTISARNYYIARATSSKLPIDLNQ